MGASNFEKVNCSLGSLHPLLEAGKGSVRSEGLHVDTVTLDLAFLLELDEIRVDVRGETVFTGDENLLTAGELKLGAPQSLDDVILK